MGKLAPARSPFVVRILFCYALIAPMLLGLAEAQSTDAATKQKLADAAKQGVQLQANLNVADNVAVEAADLLIKFFAKGKCCCCN